MLALAHPTAAAPAVLAHPVSYDGPRIAAADFFTLARTGRAQTTLPPFRDGDSVSCPQGTEWMRYDGRWIVPGWPGGLTLDDRTVTGWWHTRHRPASKFALVHRLNADETDRITGDRYISRSRLLSLRDGAFTYTEPVSGPWLRQLARQITCTRTVSVHLELPTGIVTLHSPAGDVFFHPTTAPADTRALCA
ncbi:hypothetical protein [Streptomyces parvus]|uniref:hypothetical protein n=1 Tax=Streptomyces parvus TaxID=66428 RepID=UPI002100C422|nr:hypothetical protein [Streptomyces parvus]MCQ1580372.1 hypothetical protein [Streptomyces parvus]